MGISQNSKSFNFYPNKPTKSSSGVPNQNPSLKKIHKKITQKLITKNTHKKKRVYLTLIGTVKACCN